MKNYITFFLLMTTALAACHAVAWEASIVSRNTISTMYNSDGTVKIKNSGEINGGTYFQTLFNGNFSDYVYNNTAKTYIIIDLDAALSGGYYVTEVKIGHVGNTKYSLFYSEDGTTWSDIVKETDAAGIRSYSVDHVARKVKYVFDTVISWTTSLGEIQVWGVDPSEVGCLHPDEFLTEWESVPGTASCVDYGIDQRQCTNCGTYLHRESLGLLPLGHDYDSVVVKRGTSLAYGSGTNVCKRCGDAIVFDEPIDLTTLGGPYMEGVVQFTAITVSSIWHPEWGAGGANKLVDGNWNDGYSAGWMAGSLDHDTEYAQFAFANTIDLTAVDISVHNHDQVVEFYSVEGGEEVLVGELAVEKNTAANAPNYQRISFEFRGVSLSTLRVRIRDSVGVELWGKQIISICELHPYGTVAGAGKSAAVRTRVIIE